MAINAVFPTLSSPVQPNAGNVLSEQSKLAPEPGEKTQTQNAVAPAENAEGDFDNGLSAGNKDGRGQLVDVKI
jgi:hypothetical protein